MEWKKTINEMVMPASVKNGLEMEGYWIWDGSVIKGEDGRYHMFASRFRNSLPFHPGWLMESEIIRASCDTPDGKFEFEEVVLKGRGAEYWDGRMVHNPHILKYGDKYVLYYIGSTHPFEDVGTDEVVDLLDPRTISGRANKRIGVAVSDSVFGPWERFPEPVLTPRADKFDNFLVSNPSPCVMPDGKVLLVYKSRCYKTPYKGLLHGPMSLGIAIADAPWEKHRAVLDEPLFCKDGYEVEDPFVWRDNDGYHMMAKDMNANICGELMGGIYASSQNGIDWEVDEGRLFYSRKLLFDDMTVQEIGNLDRPFILFEDNKPVCVYFAVSDGKDGEGFMNCTKTWNMPLKFKE